MQQLVHRTKSAATGTIQTGELMEMANGIDGNSSRIDKKQNRGCADYSNERECEENGFRADIHEISQPVNPVTLIQHADRAEND